MKATKTATRKAGNKPRYNYPLSMLKMPAISYSLAMLFLLSTIFFACNKEQDFTGKLKSYEVIEPESYLPVYPNSWWKYRINDSETTTLAVSSAYQLHSYKMSNSFYDEPVYSDTVLVPFLDGNPVYGYERIEWKAPPFGGFYIKWPILSETVGYKFQRRWEDKRYGDFAERVEVKEKFFNGTDSILILEGYWVYGPNAHNKSYQAYAKGIGLVKEFTIDTLTNDTLFKKVLVEYFVNELAFIAHGLSGL